MFRSKDHPQGATLSLLKSLLKISYRLLPLYNPGSVAACLVAKSARDTHAAKHRTHTRSRALLATYPYTTIHAATEPGLYKESNQ